MERKELLTGCAGDELVPVHQQIFLHPAKKRIINISLIKVFQKITDLQIKLEAVIQSRCEKIR